MIESFGFGSLVIDGRTYVQDLIIYPDGRIIDSWRRKSGHRLASEDIDSLIALAPEIIVAGTGIHGFMKPDRDLEERLMQKGIGFVAERNHNAVERYNALSKKKKVGACFHLTC